MKQVINRGNRSKTMRTVYQKKKKIQFAIKKGTLSYNCFFSHNK